MTIQTVSEINQSIKLLLENSFSFISVKGEITNLRKPFSGHLYFSLKDPKCQLKAVLFKMQQRYLSKDIKDGMEVVCHGRISVYEPRGEYQLIIDTIDFQGEGSLQIAFENLKQKLQNEGLFDQENKKPLPFLPETIALITSPRGAAVQDFLKAAARRCPSVPIDIHPVSVQGDTAAGEIIKSIQIINQTNSADIIVLCRGGGSIEDLWTFNDESLAQTIFNSNIPIISAIGHEIDFTIADFTADCRAATPTAAVDYALPDASLLLAQIAKHEKQMLKSLTGNFSYLRDKIRALKRALGSPVSMINHDRMRIDYSLNKCAHALNTAIQVKKYNLLRTEEKLSALTPQRLLDNQRQHTMELSNRLKIGMTHILEKKGHKLDSQTNILNAVNPLAILDRGYAIVQDLDKKTIIKSKSQVTEGDKLNILLTDGKIRTQVLPETG